MPKFHNFHYYLPFDDIYYYKIPSILNAFTIIKCIIEERIAQFVITVTHHHKILLALHCTIRYYWHCIEILFATSLPIKSFKFNPFFLLLTMRLESLQKFIVHKQQVKRQKKKNQHENVDEKLLVNVVFIKYN